MRYGPLLGLPLLRNPFKPNIAALYATYTTGAHTSDPFEDGKGPYYLEGQAGEIVVDRY